MRSETFTIQGRELESGGIYFTSEDLPGFRLLVQDADQVQSEVTAALRAFYPVFIAAKAQAEARHREPRLGKMDRSHGTIDLSAEFAFA